MKKNALAKSAQIHPTKKFNTSIKNFSAAKKAQLSSNKLKTSVNNNNTKRSNNPPSTSDKARKSVQITTNKKKTEKNNNIETNKKKSIFKKPEAKSVKKTTDKKLKTSVNIKNSVPSPKVSMSVNLKRDNTGKGKSKTTKVQNVNLFNSSKGKSKKKTTKKSVEINDIVDEEENINSKKNQNFRDLKNSQAFNKNESIGINIMNNINDENENFNEDNNIILENENEKNLTAEKLNSKENENNQLNSPIQNDFIKERIEEGFINGNAFNPNQEFRLKNKKVETSNYISEKNKNTMRNLLYLLEKKPEESKNQKSLFRSSLNNLDKKEKSKLIDMVYQNRKKLYKMHLIDEVKRISNLNSPSSIKPNSLNAINELNEIERDKIDQTPISKSPFPLYPNNFEDKYQTMKNKYLVMVSPPNPRKPYPTFYKDKYFIDYVDGKCPNLSILERTMKYQKNMHDINKMNNGTVTERHSFNRSYNGGFHVKEKNDLSVEKRDKRYMYYNYGFMINTIDDKLNGYITDKNFRHSFQPLHKTNSDFGLNKGQGDSNRTERVSKLYNDINSNINMIQDYGMRKTYSERNPFL